MERLNLNEIEPRELVPGFKARFVHSKNMTLAFWEVAAGSSLPVHSHPHEQVVNMLEGELKFRVATDVVLEYTSLVNNFSGHCVKSIAAYTQNCFSMSEGSIGSLLAHGRAPTSMRDTV